MDFGKRKVLALVLGLVVILGAAWWGIGRLTDPYDCRVAPGVTLGGLDIGGMTPRQARQALESGGADTILTLPLTVTLPEQTLTLAPADLNLKPDIRAAVRSAYRVGRKADAVEQNLGLLPFLTLNREEIQSRLDAYAQAHDSSLTQPAWVLEGAAPTLSTENPMEDVACQTLSLTLGTPEARLDTAAALDAILALYDLPFTAGQNVAIDVPVAQEPEKPDLAAIGKEICVAPVDDAPDMETHGLKYGSYGYGFSESDAQALLAQARWGDTVAIPMTCTAPAVTGQMALFQDVLGSCDTRHNTNENRNNNLRLLSEALNGYILEPGEEFSYNEAVGERTAERGYLPAPAYSGNRLTNSVGGGVCQGSSTLYNCVLLADLEVTHRVCHGATINYLPLGLDAAVNWATTDFCFRNNWNFPIMIQAEVTEENLCMKILGTDEKDYYLELSANSWRDGSVTYASSYKHKYDKKSGELISKDRIGYSTYYHLD